MVLRGTPGNTCSASDAQGSRNRPRDWIAFISIWTSGNERDASDMLGSRADPVLSVQTWACTAAGTVLVIGLSLGLFRCGLARGLLGMCVVHQTGRAAEANLGPGLGVGRGADQGAPAEYIIYIGLDYKGRQEQA
eukprot:scaffold218808_cov20-Tisochrysis_lutea.AAC.3